MAGQSAVVAATDERWFEFLQSRAVNGRLDEVNFWRPSGSSFRALEPGGPFFFRLKSPVNAIVGYGYFAAFSVIPVQVAWMAFEQRNGDATFPGLLNRIAEYRHESPGETVLGSKPLGCIVLREVQFFDRSDWIPWGLSEEWHPNIVAYKTYDLASALGSTLRGLLRSGEPAELLPDFELVGGDQRSRAEAFGVVREGQGAFRVRVLDAYGRRCAITGERSLPVLEAAHIQPYLGAPSNHIQNGLSLRADIHRLFDTGYVTVTPDLTFEVSSHLKQDFENGREYYDFSGKKLLVLPAKGELLPSAKALEWHANRVFLG